MISHSNKIYTNLISKNKESKSRKPIKYFRHDSWMKNIKKPKSEDFQISSNILVSASNVVNKPIPSNVISIDDAQIENNVLDNWAFKESKNSLKEVTFEENSEIQRIGSYAFYSCRNLQSVDLSNCKHLSSISSWAFSICFSLKSFVFTSTITSLGNNVFRSNPINETFDISKITKLEYDSFVNTTLSFKCDSTSSIRRQYETDIYNTDFTELVLVSFSTKKLKLHQNTRIIAWCAFSSTSLEEVILPPQITTVSQYSFHINDYIRKIVLSENIESINLPYVFISSISNLEIVYFPEGLKEIISSAIRSCPKLKFIHIPSTLQTVNENTFNVPSVLHVTYKKSQYLMLLNGGIPKNALIHLHTICHRFNLIFHPSYFLYIHICI